MRGASCCWIDAPFCQSFGRIPQPLISAGSMFSGGCVAVPNVCADDAPHTPLAALFVKLQFGILSTPTGTVMIDATVEPAGKLRVALVAMRAIGLLIE